MDEEKMTEEEAAAYHSPWSNVLKAMARTWALILERVREAAQKVRTREKAVDERVEAVEKREREADQQGEKLNAEAETLAGTAAALDKDKASHQANLVDLQQRGEQMKSAAKEHRDWVFVTDMLTEFPEMFELTSKGRVSLSVNGIKSSERWFIELVNAEPPEWVKSVVKQQHKLAATLASAAQKETEAGKTVAELSDILTRAGSILTPEQQPIASDANRAIRKYELPPGGMER